MVRWLWAVARRLPVALGLGSDPRGWGDDEALVFLVSEGDDLAGDLIVGDAPLARYQARRFEPVAGLADSARAGRYPELVKESQSGGLVGSSVEGEQPKFLAVLERAAGCRCVDCTRRLAVVIRTTGLSRPTRS